jgi:hypothetical protein
MKQVTIVMHVHMIGNLLTFMIQEIRFWLILLKIFQLKLQIHLLLSKTWKVINVNFALKRTKSYRISSLSNCQNCLCLQRKMCIIRKTQCKFFNKTAKLPKLR